MAFGTIVVQTEDGSQTEYEISKPLTTIGRQSTNDIVLNTSSVSRYHARLEVAQGGMVIVDQESKHRTFLGDDVIPYETPIELNHGDVLTMGEVRLTFYAPQGVRTVELMPGATTLQDSNVPFRVELDEPHQAVAPGARLQLMVTITSTADENMTLFLGLDGMNEEWAKSNRREILIEPGETTEAKITVRPPRSTHTRPGLYALTIRVEDVHDNSVYLEAVREIEVVGYTAFGMGLKTGGQQGSFRVSAENFGNVPINIRLTGFDRRKRLAYRFEPDTLHLEPGDTAHSSLTVKTSGRRPVRRGEYVEFAVLANSQDDAGYLAPVTAAYDVQPSWPMLAAGLGLPAILGGGLLLIVAAALLYFVLFSGAGPSLSPSSQGVTEEAVAAVPEATVEPTELPPTPTLIPTPSARIEAFSIEPENVIYGTIDTITLQWDAIGQTEVTITDESGKPLPLSSDDLTLGRRSLSVSNLKPGEHGFALTIVGEDGMPRTETAGVTVRQILCRAGEEAYALFAGPDDDAEELLTLEAADLVLTGRDVDAEWMYVGTVDLSIKGWMRAADLECPDNAPPFDAFIVIGS